jgi:class 3 adenylate cyclase/ABC-type Fe3+ transport system substrate-binding protein
MHCPRCQTDNRAGRKFCAACGQALSITCLHCDFINEPEDRFCGGCGQALTPPALPPASALEPAPRIYTPKHLADKILSSRSALEGERKQVTVLFADTAGFTALARDLDPEVVHEVMDQCFALLTAEVHRFEGTINQYTGDGVMALFGAPIAHEDSPRRAVHAALGVQRAMQDFGRELQAQRGFSLQMRIGVNTGLVVVGKIGDDLRMDYTAVGDTTNLAARLQQLAQPGTVIISEATHWLVTGFFDTRDLGEHAIKGHTEPVRAYEVLQARGRRTRLEVAAERGLTPRVGRDRELTTLLDLFQQAKTGHGQAVSITGEACIGKSRLVLEFRRALAAEEPVTWLEGQCLSFGQAIPFLPVVDQLRANFGIEEADGEPVYKDADGLWTGWYIGIFGFVLHPDRFAKDLKDLEQPTSWDDLLAPTWKGHLTLPDPVKTGGGYIFIATQIFRFAAAAMPAGLATPPTAEQYAAAEDKAMDYMKKLHANIGQYTGTAPQAIQLVGQGQFIGAPNWSHDILTAKSQGQPIDNLNPQPTGFEVGAVSIIKGGPNADGAKAFVDWVLSQEAGALNVKLSNRLSVLKDVAPASGAPTLESVQLVPYDRAWATNNKARLLKKWQATVG